MNSQRIPSGKIYPELTGFHRGESPVAQSDLAHAGEPSMGISAKHNPDPLKPWQRSQSSEPEQYK